MCRCMLMCWFVNQLMLVCQFWFVDVWCVDVWCVDVWCLMCWCVDVWCVSWCVDLLMLMCWCSDVLSCWWHCVNVLTVLMCQWCVSWCVLMCWWHCVDVLMCWHVMCWVLMCWCVDVFAWCADLLLEQERNQPLFLVTTGISNSRLIWRISSPNNFAFLWVEIIYWFVVEYYFVKQNAPTHRTSTHQAINTPTRQLIDTTR
jgi:hypothetical protein